MSFLGLQLEDLIEERVHKGWLGQAGQAPTGPQDEPEKTPAEVDFSKKAQKAQRRERAEKAAGKHSNYADEMWRHGQGMGRKEHGREPGQFTEADLNSFRFGDAFMKRSRCV